MLCGGTVELAWAASVDSVCVLLQGQLWSTYSKIGYYSWHHVFAAEMLAPFSVTPMMLMSEMPSNLASEGEAAGSPMMVAYSVPAVSFDIQKLSIVPFGPTQPLQVPACNRSDFVVFHVAKVYASGWALLGELDKWVPVSPARFRSVSQDTFSISALVAGKVGEVVHVAFSNPSLKVVVVDVTIQSNGRALVTQPTNGDPAFVTSF